MKNISQLEANESKIPKSSQMEGTWLTRSNVRIKLMSFSLFRLGKPAIKSWQMISFDSKQHLIVLYSGI